MFCLSESLQAFILYHSVLEILPGHTWMSVSTPQSSLKFHEIFYLGIKSPFTLWMFSFNVCLVVISPQDLSRSLFPRDLCLFIHLLCALKWFLCSILQSTDWDLNQLFTHYHQSSGTQQGISQQRFKQRLYQRPTA